MLVLTSPSEKYPYVFAYYVLHVRLCKEVLHVSVTYRFEQ